MQSAASFSRDANRVPITKPGLQVKKSITLVTGNTTHYFPLFTVTGAVEVMTLYGIVTTALGSNVTAAYWREQDQTTQADISLNTGTTLSSASIGSVIARISVATIALSLKNSSAGGVLDPVAATAPDVFMPFVVVQKTGSIKTEIEFVYTTNNGSLGAIQFFCGFIPISTDGDVIPSTTDAY